MIPSAIGEAISLAFFNLSQHNQMIYDYWLSELYDDDGDLLVNEWNKENLLLMEQDVINQLQAVDNF